MSWLIDTWREGTVIKKANQEKRVTVNAMKQRAYRARKAEAEGRTLGTRGRPRVAHGASAYNGGCRCDVCRAANTERKRRARAAAKASPSS